MVEARSGASGVGSFGARTFAVAGAAAALGSAALLPCGGRAARGRAAHHRGEEELNRFGVGRKSHAIRAHVLSTISQKAWDPTPYWAVQR